MPTRPIVIEVFGLIMNGINRRNFLTYTATSGLSLTAQFSLISAMSLTACSTTHINQDRAIISGYSHTDISGKRLKEYGVLAIQAKNKTQHSRYSYVIVSDFSVPHEVHLATLFPDQKSILVCSRKPGASLLKYSLTGKLLAKLKPLENQHFEGHGIFSSDEKYLYVTASDFLQGKGKLLKLNSNDLSLVEQFDTQGIGPHELVWQNDEHIAIANTGVLTHPDSGRKILNPDSIQSNIVLFNVQDYKIHYEWKVPQLGLSARHLDRMDDGSLVIGCQYKKQDKRPACIAFANMTQGLVFADTDNDSLHWDMQGYSASIKAIPNSNQALISNPRGHLLTQWYEKNEKTQQLIEQKKIKYNKGIKIHPQGEKAWVSQGAGQLLSWDIENRSLEGESIKIKDNIWWGNHLG